jgi:hypothetical protein
VHEYFKGSKEDLSKIILLSKLLVQKRRVGEIFFRSGSHVCARCHDQNPHMSENVKDVHLSMTSLTHNNIELAMQPHNI